MQALPPLKFSGKIWQWRGPAPFYFVTVPTRESKEIKSISKMVTYGWGMIPVNASIGKTEFKTSLFYKDNHYGVPIKSVVRNAEKLEEGDKVEISLCLP